MIELKEKEIMGLYLLLRKQDTLDMILDGLCCKFERILFEKLSIEEMEQLEKIYMLHENKECIP